MTAVRVRGVNEANDHYKINIVRVGKCSRALYVLNVLFQRHIKTRKRFLLGKKADENIGRFTMLLWLYLSLHTFFFAFDEIYDVLDQKFLSTFKKIFPRLFKTK